MLDQEQLKRWAEHLVIVGTTREIEFAAAFLALSDRIEKLESEKVHSTFKIGDRVRLTFDGRAGIISGYTGVIKSMEQINSISGEMWAVLDDVRNLNAVRVPNEDGELQVSLDHLEYDNGHKGSSPPQSDVPGEDPTEEPFSMESHIDSLKAAKGECCDLYEGVPTYLAYYLEGPGKAELEVGGPHHQTLCYLHGVYEELLEMRQEFCQEYKPMVEANKEAVIRAFIGYWAEIEWNSDEDSWILHGVEEVTKVTPELWKDEPDPPKGIRDGMREEPASEV